MGLSLDNLLNPESVFVFLYVYKKSYVLRFLKDFTAEDKHYPVINYCLVSVIIVVLGN